MLVAIIGAGPSGLAMAYHSLQQGVEVLLLEQSNHIGGTWWYDEKIYETNIFPNLTANTRAKDLAFPGFPFEAQGEFPTSSEYCIYLQDFATKTGVMDCIRFNALVENVTVSEKNAAKWSLQITDTSINVPMEFEADFVAVANGHYRVPKKLTEEHIPGISSFKGDQVHSSKFRDPIIAAQKNVLVVGMGSSGVEVLRRISGMAQEAVGCSMRMDKVAKSPRGKKNTPYPDQYGTGGELSSVASLRPKIKAFKNGEVVFVDGTSFKPDLIVWCTGFVYSFPFLSSDILSVGKGRVELYQHMFPMSGICKQDSFAVIGLPSPSGAESIVPIVDAQAKLFSAMIAKKCKLPSRGDREAWLDNKRKSWVPGMYRPLQVNVSTYLADLQSISGVTSGLGLSGKKAIASKEVSFRNTANASEMSDLSEEEEGEFEEEEETYSASKEEVVVVEEGKKITTPGRATGKSVEAPVVPTAVEAEAPSRSGTPKKHVLAKSEGMKSLNIEKQSAAATPSTSGTVTPLLNSRSNTLSGLDSAKTGVFSSFGRTPTKEIQPTILGRILGEKKGTPYPKDLMKKNQAILRTSVYPHMICVPSSGACGEIGKRELMEDAHVLLDKIPGVPETIPSGFWAVYDGHGGVEVSRMCEQMLHVRFQKMLVNALIIEGKSVKEVNVERLLRRCFKETDRLINQKLAEMGNVNVGSTASVVVLLGRRLFCANTGDSEVIVAVNHLGSDETLAVEMSHKHKPREDREKTRIETLGGMVFGGRVYGTLSVARGFGDTQFKPPVNPQYIICPDPDVKVIEMAPQHRYLILACDGLWDKVTHHEAAVFVHELRQNGYSVEECAAWLVKEADDRISRDNISVVVVDLHWSVEAKLENPKTCPECNSVTFGVSYCTKCGLPWEGAVQNNNIRQAPSVKGKRGKSYKLKKVKRSIEENEEEEFVIGTPTDVAHKAHAQSVEEARKLLGK